jgi:3-dehydrosphinganine reductase
VPPRVSVVTGGSSGLGLALARALAVGGDRVILIARDTAKLDAAMSSITQHCATNTVFCKAVDVTQGPAMKTVADQIAAEHGCIDLWINSAGIMREGYFENLTDSDFREVFDINLFGTINCVRTALPHIRKTKGQIVNIASMAAHTGVFGYTAYCASKHALKGFTESLYHELRPQGITVQLICPPEFESPMATALDEGRTPENAAHTLMIPREPVEVIVRDTLKAIASRRYHTITGLNARVMGFAIQHMPGLAREIAQLTIRRVQKRRGR